MIVFSGAVCCNLVVSSSSVNSGTRFEVKVFCCVVRMRTPILLSRWEGMNRIPEYSKLRVRKMRMWKKEVRSPEVRVPILGIPRVSQTCDRNGSRSRARAQLPANENP